MMGECSKSKQLWHTASEYGSETIIGRKNWVGGRRAALTSHRRAALEPVHLQPLVSTQRAEPLALAPRDRRRARAGRHKALVQRHVAAARLGA